MADVCESMRVIEDVTYAEVDGVALQLDLLLPTGKVRPPLLLWIHGGGWRQGSRKSPGIRYMVDRGFAMATISYRLSMQAIFPAQIHDCKAAVRWLRAHGGEYGFDATNIIAMGGSAGGHLAGMLATTAGHAELEGTVGGNLEQSSAVQGAVSIAGPMDLALRHRTNPNRHAVPEGPSYGLLGGNIGGELEALASPSTHVNEHAAPLLILHGLADTSVLPIQSTRIADCYAQHRRRCELHFVEGAGHGGIGITEGHYRDVIVDFIERLAADLATASEAEP